MSEYADWAEAEIQAELEGQHDERCECAYCMGDLDL